MFLVKLVLRVLSDFDSWLGLYIHSWWVTVVTNRAYTFGIFMNFEQLRFDLSEWWNFFESPKQRPDCNACWWPVGTFPLFTLFSRFTLTSDYDFAVTNTVHNLIMSLEYNKINLISRTQNNKIYLNFSILKKSI